MSNGADRSAFEAWYVANAFDLAASPLGSRHCALQWTAWRAGWIAREDEMQMSLRITEFYTDRKNSGLATLAK